MTAQHRWALTGTPASCGLDGPRKGERPIGLRAPWERASTPSGAFARSMRNARTPSERRSR